MSKNALSKRNWFTICLFSFMGGVAWNVENMYFNTFLYNSVYANTSAAAQAGSMAPTTAISRMVALSAIAAVVTTFIMGTLSDELKNRKLFISVGYIFWGVITGLFGLITKDNVAGLLHLSDEAKILTATVWVVIIMDIIMTFMGSTSNDAAFNAWVTDITTPKIRPTLEIILQIVGFASAGAVMGVGSFAQAGKVSYQTFFIMLGLFVTLCGIAGLFLIKEPENRAVKEERSGYWANLFYGFRPSAVRDNIRLYLTLFAVGLSTIAYQIFFPYLLVYLQYVVIPANGGDSFLTAGVIVTGVIVVLLIAAGIIILMKVGAKNKAYCLVPCAILMPLGLFILSTSTDITVILIGLCPTVVGYIISTIQLNAAVKDFIPVGKAGLFQGIRMIFVVLIPMVLGPVLGDMACRNSAVTYTNEYGVQTLVPSGSMFFYAAVAAAFVIVPLIFLIRKGFDTEEQAEVTVNE